MDDKNLNLLREKIDNIDEEMAKLFSKRMDLIKQVKEIKKENNLPVLDSKREKIIYDKNSTFISKEYSNEYLEFITKLLEISKNYQTK